MLRDLEDQVNRLRNSIQPAIQLAVDATDQAEAMKREIYVEMQKGCTPLFQLYRLYSTDERSPGNLLSQRLQKLEAGVAKVTAEVNVGSGSVSITVPPSPVARGGAPFGFNLSNHADERRPSSEAMQQDEDRYTPGQYDTAEAVARIVALEAQMHDLKNQMLAIAVTIGGTLFKSRVDVKIVAGFARGSSGFVHFLHGCALGDGPEAGS